MSNQQPPEQQRPPAYTQYGRSPQQSPIPVPAPRSPRQSHIGWIIVGVFSVLVVLGCIGVLVLAARPAGRPSVITGPHQAILVSTQATTATPTGPHIITEATLGGTQDAFTAKYGAPVTSGPTVDYGFTLADGTGAGVCICGTAAGLDGRQHVEYMKVGPVIGVTWTHATKTAEAKQFMPLDAIYVRTIQDPDVGPILVYTSADLAKTFPASEFTDSAGGPNPPAGTFSVTCQQPGIAFCTIETGT